jgi:Lrp/AsnC family transcriptional regulator, leucine-responsive regulatory protein
VRALEGLDELDRKLLESLQADDQRGLAELAKQTGSSPSTINDRIKRLIRNGVITGFHARVAAESVGLGLLAFVLVSLSSKAERRFLKKVEASQNVLECHRIAGEWNYLIKLRVKNVRDLEAYLAALSKLIGVQRTNSLIAMSSIKESWAIASA